MKNQYKHYDEKYFEDSSDRHKIMTQFYRGIQVFEGRDPGEKDLSDLFTNEMVFKHSEWMKNISEGKKSYHVENITIKSHEHGKFIVSAEILSQELSKDGKCKNYRLDCKVVLLNDQEVLPIIDSIEVEQIKELPEETYKSSYAYNRARSIAHYWIYILENLDQYISHYDEIVAPEFMVSTKTGDAITDMKSYRAWLRAGDARVSYTCHNFKMFEVETEENNEIKFKFQFDWQGYSTDYKPMKAESQHHWVIIDNPEDRFASIKEIDMKMIIPFTVIEV